MIKKYDIIAVIIPLIRKRMIGYFFVSLTRPSIMFLLAKKLNGSVMILNNVFKIFILLPHEDT